MASSSESANPQQVIGLIGSMSWKSSAKSYRLINEDVRTRLGGLHAEAAMLRSLGLRGVEGKQ